ncbi:hypothetical protein [Mycolicibacterium phage J1]|nr:hypothetical protein [Mycolicibacterium phage J1]
MAGSIEKRGKNKYRLTVSMGSGKNRKRYRRTVECKTKPQAEKELAKFVAEIEGDNFIEPSKLTFKSYANKWLDDYARPNLAPKTVYEYERLLELRISPFFGHIKLNKIKPIHILDFYKALQREGTLSNNSIMNYHRLLRKMFNDAVKWQILNDNPVVRVDPPATTKPKAKYYDEEDIDKLMKALEGEPTKYVCAILVTMASGFRLGELMGLQWKHIDFKNNTIEI